MKVGQNVRILRVPADVLLRGDDDLNTRTIFELSVGRVFPVVGVANGLIELEVGDVVGEPAHMHSIWIEPDCVEPA